MRILETVLKMMGFPVNVMGMSVVHEMTIQQLPTQSSCKLLSGRYKSPPSTKLPSHIHIHSSPTNEHAPKTPVPQQQKIQDEL